jgi:hypothetical protein
MLSSQSLSQKIGRQGQKDVTGGIVPTDFQKFLIVFYSLLKMTTGCYSLALDPEPTKTPIKSIFSNTSNYTQCFNILPSHQFALMIRKPLKQLNLTILNKFMAAVLKEHLHHVDLYADMLEKKIDQMEFANKI